MTFLPSTQLAPNAPWPYPRTVRQREVAPLPPKPKPHGRSPKTVEPKILEYLKRYGIGSSTEMKKAGVASTHQSINRVLRNLANEGKVRPRMVNGSLRYTL